ncbi:uncharacterized protein B0T23DRAFT_213349 [Neurospora hispaniola]|uniref:Uncharacterized protein n=1 Tax=Neurospora hispaniola TaxID=588809 RepID=A0AAJ0I255_9PEZI|nr:hypothetical protein B0T23DRAFT_213349 [Neurospora hispaniola]
MMDGIVSQETMVETTAVAAIERKGSSSLWSPRDVLQPNSLSEIIAQHWGADTEGDVIHRILTSRSSRPQRRARNFQQTPLLVHSYDTSGTSSAFSISSGQDTNLIPRAQIRFGIPRQGQSALAIRLAKRPAARLTNVKATELKSDNVVRPSTPLTRAAPLIPIRQTSLNTRTHAPSLSDAEGGRGSQQQGTLQSFKKDFWFFPGEESDSSGNDSVAAEADGYCGREANTHAHGSVTREIRTVDEAVVGRLSRIASISFAEAYKGGDYQSQHLEHDEHGMLSDAKERVTPVSARSSYSNQTNLACFQFTRTPRTGGSTDSIIKKNEGNCINASGSSDDNGRPETNESIYQGTDSLRTRVRPSRHSYSPSLGSSSAIATAATSRQYRRRASAKQPSPPPPRLSIPGASSSPEGVSRTTCLSRTSSMTTRKASPADFEAMEFGLLDTGRSRAGQGIRATTRCGRGGGYDGGHSDQDPRDTESCGRDVGFTMQTLPSRNNRQSRVENGSGGFLGIDRVRQVAGSVNGPNKLRSRVAAVTAKYENGGGAGGSLNDRAGSSTGSWKQRGDQGKGVKGTERGERARENKDKEKEKQSGRWAWPIWWL